MQKVVLDLQAPLRLRSVQEPRGGCHSSSTKLADSTAVPLRKPAVTIGHKASVYSSVGCTVESHLGVMPINRYEDWLLLLLCYTLHSLSCFQRQGGSRPPTESGVVSARLIDYQKSCCLCNLQRAACQTGYNSQLQCHIRHAATLSVMSLIRAHQECIYFVLTCTDDL